MARKLRLEVGGVVCRAINAPSSRKPLELSRRNKRVFLKPRFLAQATRREFSQP
jgi:hypothetical protein